MPARGIWNKSNSPIDCFVSTYGGSGDDSWFPLPANGQDTWNRPGWELVAFKNQNNNNQRGGVYVNFASNFRIEFHNFNDIRVLPA